MDIISVIQETATWIEKVNNDYDVNLYRSPELTPKQHYYEIPDEEREAVVNDIIAKRSLLLKQADVSLIPVKELRNYGRIMLFGTYQAIPDGAATDASAYYIDDNDSPPFDTWIATGKQLTDIEFYTPNNGLADYMLIAWIPNSQYFYAEEAMNVSMLGIFEWPTNEHIIKRFSAVANLFSEPGQKIEPDTKINHYKRAYTMNKIMEQLDKNSSPYYVPEKPNDSLMEKIKKLFK